MHYQHTTKKNQSENVIEKFFATGVVDEVIVCNNNAAEGTSEEIAQTDAVEVFESRQGYGWSCQKAMAEATGDLIVLAEPDGSFEPSDIFKLLAYANDFDIVLGSRTHSTLIWQGANMGRFLKWGNWVVAKYLEVIFNTTQLSDVGCTMRLLKREILETIEPHFSVGGSHFGPEVMLLCVQSKVPFIEIPLNYKQRVGESMVTGSHYKAFILGLQMIAMITTFRIKTLLGAGPKVMHIPPSSKTHHPIDAAREDADKDANE